MSVQMKVLKKLEVRQVGFHFAATGIQFLHLLFSCYYPIYLHLHKCILSQCEDICMHSWYTPKDIFANFQGRTMEQILELSVELNEIISWPWSKGCGYRDVGFVQSACQPAPEQFVRINKCNSLIRVMLAETNVDFLINKCGLQAGFTYVFFP